LVQAGRALQWSAAAPLRALGWLARAQVRHRRGPDHGAARQLVARAHEQVASANLLGLDHAQAAHFLSLPPSLSLSLFTSLAWTMRRPLVALERSWGRPRAGAWKAAAPAALNATTAHATTLLCTIASADLRVRRMNPGVLLVGYV